MKLASLLPNVANFQVIVGGTRDRLVFLHQVRPGGSQPQLWHRTPAWRVPAPVVRRAR